MEILTTTTVFEKTLTIGDTWNIGNNTIITLCELFDIEGEVFMTTTVSNQPIMIKINKTGEIYESKRFINSAKKWVGENINLFS
jgi:hypothetical protein